MKRAAKEALKNHGKEIRAELETILRECGGPIVKKALRNKNELNREWEAWIARIRKKKREMARATGKEEEPATSGVGEEPHR